MNNCLFFFFWWDVFFVVDYLDVVVCGVDEDDFDGEYDEIVLVRFLVGAEDGGYG